MSIQVSSQYLNGSKPALLPDLTRRGCVRGAAREDWHNCCNDATGERRTAETAVLDGSIMQFAVNFSFAGNTSDVLLRVQNYLCQ
jgi:hypothetical protein